MSLDTELFSEAIAESNYPIVVVVQDGCVSDVYIPPSESTTNMSNDDNPLYMLRGVDSALVLDCDGVLSFDDVDTATSILCDELGYTVLPQIDSDNLASEFGFELSDEDTDDDD